MKNVFKEIIWIYSVRWFVCLFNHIYKVEQTSLPKNPSIDWYWCKALLNQTVTNRSKPIQLWSFVNHEINYNYTNLLLDTCTCKYEAASCVLLTIVWEVNLRKNGKTPTYEMLKYLFVSFLGIPNAFLVIVFSSIAKVSLDITNEEQPKFKEPSIFGPLMPNSQRYFFFHQQYVSKKKL